MCAARIASVEPNSVRAVASETPARAEMSPKPICSKRFSASSAMKAAMIFVASVPPAAAMRARWARLWNVAACGP